MLTQGACEEIGAGIPGGHKARSRSGRAGRQRSGGLAWKWAAGRRLGLRIQSHTTGGAFRLTDLQIWRYLFPVRWG